MNVPYDILERELGAASLDNGDRVTPETARRMACDCTGLMRAWTV